MIDRIEVFLGDFYSTVKEVVFYYFIYLVISRGVKADMFFFWVISMFICKKLMLLAATHLRLRGPLYFIVSLGIFLIVPLTGLNILYRADHNQLFITGQYISMFFTVSYFYYSYRGRRYNTILQRKKHSKDL